jgi:adenosylcobinamide-phosphate synthase
MVLPAVVLWISLGIDRLWGDPPNAYHPTAYLGRFIGWWGRPDLYSPTFQRIAGSIMCCLTAILYTFPFYLVEWYAPGWAYLLLAPFLLKICYAWRCLEDHVNSVVMALNGGMEDGRMSVQMLVSRNTRTLGHEEILSAAYESMTENIVDSILAPLFYFSILGLPGAAFYRAVNTMDAMLGYRDERVRIGWFPARFDDILNYIPARIAGLLLLGYFFIKGRGRAAMDVLHRDRAKRPGINGGIPMAVMAGGVGVTFTKPNTYTIGNGSRTFEEAGKEIITAARAITLMTAVLCTLIILAIGMIR